MTGGRALTAVIVVVLAGVSAIPAGAGLADWEASAQSSAAPGVTYVMDKGTPSIVPTQVLLTPTEDPRTSQRVSWNMRRVRRDLRVQYRRPGFSARTSFAKRVRGTTPPRFTATMRGLRPGVTYQYRIVWRKGHTSWWSFRTAGKTNRTTILSFGDTQLDHRGVAAASVRMATRRVRGEDLFLLAGDVTDDPRVADSWQAQLRAMGSTARSHNWIVAMGNHDRCIWTPGCTPNEGEVFRSYFPIPAGTRAPTGPTWYMIDYQGVRVIVLDSFAGKMEEQATFLSEALATNPRPWSIVLMHSPAFSSIPGRTSDEIRRLWVPVMEANDADLVLSGHEHSYARGFLRPDGPVYVTSFSGPNYYPATDVDWIAGGATRVTWAVGVSTFQVIQITSQTLTYEAVVSHADPTLGGPIGIGGVLDSFTLRKESVIAGTPS